MEKNYNELREEVERAANKMAAARKQINAAQEQLKIATAEWIEAEKRLTEAKVRKELEATDGK